MTKQPDTNLASTIISETIRVSTGLVRSGCNGVPFTYFESWIFSDDPRVKSRQFIHGTLSGEATRKDVSDREYRKAIEWHNRVAWALSNKFGDMKQLRADLATAQERIVALETNINEGNLLMQRFTDGDILYSREEVPVTMKGLAAKLHKEQATIATLTDDLASLNKHYELYVDKYVKATAERDAARAALSDMIDDHVLPYPEPYWDDYPKYKARNDAARERLANAKAALAPAPPQEDSDE